MRQPLRAVLATALLLLLSVLPAAAREELTSPDGRIRVALTLSAAAEGGVPAGTPYYNVDYQGSPVLLPSRLGLDLDGQADLLYFFRVERTERSERRGAWRPVLGERAEYPDCYNELAVTLRETVSPGRAMRVVLRAYDEGVALRYELPAGEGWGRVTVGGELTEYVFPRHTSVWESHGNEGKYYKVYPEETRPDCELPLTCLTPAGAYAVVADADCGHYPRAFLNSVRGRQGAMRLTLRGQARSRADGLTTAWHAMTIGPTPGSIIERNYLLYNLNEPCRIADPSWIRPGTAIRETTFSTEEGLRLVDFCGRMGIDNIIYDSGWYGLERSPESDPTRVRAVDNATGEAKNPPLDLPRVISYARERGVGVFLYVNRIALERYGDRIFPLYEQWGVRGIKPGFVRTGSQEWQEWIEELVAKAARHHLLVDIHDAYRPDGLSRTWPNLLTQEGIHGNEHGPGPDHDALLPFTRYTIGAADYTPGYLRGDLQGTLAHRLALPVVFYSPGMFLFWREKPDARYESHPELALWSHLPTTWDDTRVLSGEIGEYVVTARRKGATWYVGGITNSCGRTVRVDFSFLQAGRKYRATIYTDGEDGQVSVSPRRVGSRESLALALKAGGGVAMKIEAL